MDRLKLPLDHDTDNQKDRMNNYIKFASMIMALACFLGCQTTTEPRSLENKAKAVAWGATTKLLQKHPEWRPHFEQAKQDLVLLQASETIGIVEVLAVVNRLPVKELREGDMALIAAGTMMFFEDELGSIALDNPEQLRAVIRGMVRGLELAGVGS